MWCRRRRGWRPEPFLRERRQQFLPGHGTGVAATDAAIPMTRRSALEWALRHNRALLVAGLLLVVLLSWAYLFAGAGMAPAIGDMVMPTGAETWSAGYALVVFAMWAVMMAAMMLPSAAPMILFYDSIASRRLARGEAAAGAGVFTLGYIAAWALFSVAATALELALESLALMLPMMHTTSIGAAGAVLVAAGIYQWTPFKQSCLRRCRSPLDFVQEHWREGTRGAFAMGLRHGAFCVGCCWLLMLLLFVGGVMNLWWISGIALFVLVEKLAPAGHWLGRVAGVLLVAWGAAVWLALV
jgi:predicted metal-binding membrane protein